MSAKFVSGVKNEPVNRHYQRHCNLPGCLPWVAGNALPQRCC
nr:MAG TPA: hypothetical protein [Caudoviricetes sp.]